MCVAPQGCVQLILGMCVAHYQYVQLILGMCVAHFRDVCSSIYGCVQLILGMCVAHWYQTLLQSSKLKLHYCVAADRAGVQRLGESSQCKTTGGCCSQCSVSQSDVLYIYYSQVSEHFKKGHANRYILDAIFFFYLFDLNWLSI